MNSKTFILLVVGIFYFSLNAYAQKTSTYIVQGTVFNSNSNQPVKNAQVWLYGKQIGDTTDNLGQYEFKVSNEYSKTRMYVRICGDAIATSKLVSFRADSLIQTDFSVSGVPSDCPSPPNTPWKVNPSEYEDYKGHIILDLHGVFFSTCRGESYRPVWPTDFRKKEIWPNNSQFGDSLFIQVKGRLDPYSEDLIPFQNLYIGEIVLIDTAKSENCDLN